MTRPIALTIAGSDSSGGAGIQADLKTFSALGVYGASVVTALTAQNTTGVSDIHVPPADFTIAQLAAVTSDLRISATKTGMLPTDETVEAVADIAVESRTAFGALIVDPVIVATSGDRLVSEAAVAALIKRLMPITTLLTPNIAEAAMLLGDKALATDDAAVVDQGRRLLSLGCAAVLMKGGHATSEDARDILITAHGRQTFAAPRIPTPNTHGTGCTLSAAITAELAKTEASNQPSEPDEQTLSVAIAAAKDYLTAALQAGTSMNIGSGSGPVDHLVSWR
ncbi:MAG: bifunctional hydroxymethylpyrimidine kinase/phosphomethylpyrimidine kinase [Pseudomonadota bacterium]